MLWLRLGLGLALGLAPWLRLGLGLALALGLTLALWLGLALALGLWLRPEVCPRKPPPIQPPATAAHSSTASLLFMERQYIGDILAGEGC